MVAALRDVALNATQLEAAPFEYSESLDTDTEHTWPVERFLLCGRDVAHLVKYTRGFSRRSP